MRRTPVAVADLCAATYHRRGIKSSFYVHGVRAHDQSDDVEERAKRVIIFHHFLASFRYIGGHSPLELSSCQLDTLATSVALQSHIHSKLIDRPAKSAAGVAFLEDYALSKSPWGS